MVDCTLSTIFKVGWRYRCFMTIDLAAYQAGGPPAADVELEARWYSKTPRRLTPADLADYRCGRASLVAEVARAIGGNILVVEPGSSAMDMVRPDMGAAPCPN